MHIKEYLQMGGYAAYVWPAVGMTLFVLAWNFISAKRKESWTKKSIRKNI